MLLGDGVMVGWLARPKVRPTEDLSDQVSCWYSVRVEKEEGGFSQNQDVATRYFASLRDVRRSRAILHAIHKLDLVKQDYFYQPPVSRTAPYQTDVVIGGRRCPCFATFPKVD
jgi:hypothetical protein